MGIGLCGLVDDDRSFAMLAFPLNASQRLSGTMAALSKLKFQDGITLRFCDSESSTEGLNVGRDIHESRESVSQRRCTIFPLRSFKPFTNPTFSPLSKTSDNWPISVSGWAICEEEKETWNCKGPGLVASCNLCRMPLCVHAHLPVCCFLQRDLQH